MSTLDDSFLNSNNVPPEGYFNNYLIDCTSDSIEVRLKAIGWDGKQPRASVLIHFESKQVKHVQLVISWSRYIGKTMAPTLWGPELHKDNYVKFESLDLASTTFINTMTSGWISISPHWQLKVKNPESGYYKCIPRSDKQG